MEEQRRRSQEASKFGVDQSAATRVDARTLFQGYEGLTATGQVLALLRQGASVEALNAGEEGEVVLDRTPFYAESGGQVGDSGELEGKDARFAVADTQKRGAAHSHLGKLESGTIRLGDTLEARVDGTRRQATALNHSATHLLHAALRKVLGTHVLQKGSRRSWSRLSGW
jgi:alanyl-tRNA synthetase